MIPNLDQLSAIGMLHVFDCYFAKRLTNLVEDKRPEILLATALASRGIRQGHVCIDLNQLEKNFFAAEEKELQLPQAELWMELLNNSPLVSDGSITTPLVLQGSRLYLNRYWRYEQRLAQELLNRTDQQTSDINEQLLQDGLNRFFDQNNEYDIADQRMAADIAVRRQLTIISGGPGTGKTTTVTKILALLQEQSFAQTENPLDILLLTPTGKAAARLSQAIRDKKNDLEADGKVIHSIPDQASTIHRALGYQSRTPTTFRYNKENPLHANVVLIDEASMVDVALMAKLFDAVSKTAKVILLGDHNQLFSVETGSILGDICRAANNSQKKGGFAECVVYLTTNFRFKKGKGIGLLTEAVHHGDSAKVVNILKDTEHGEIALSPVGEANKVSAELCREVVDGYRDYLTADGPLAALRSFERFRVLCAHRHGFGGVEHLNAIIERFLAKEGLLTPQKEWYKGRPVMVLANNYSMQLFNGDIGVAWPDSEKSNELRVYFAGVSLDKLRGFQPLRLPRHETVFAMTIHKSQGSEFDKVAVVFPQEESPILSRELLYTAISRAREKLTVFASEDVLCKAVSHQIERASGLSERLTNS